MRIEKNMSNDELFLFAEKSIQKEQSIQDYVKNYDQYMQMSAEKLQNLYRKQPVENRETLPDIPEQKEAEKEWNYKKRKKRLQKKQEQEARQRLQDEMLQGDEIMARQEADQLLWEAQESRQSDLEQLRQNMRKDPKYSFIQSSHLDSVSQYQAIEEVKRSLEEHPEQYEGNKAKLDTMYEEYFHLMEAAGSFQESVLTITGVQFDPEKVSSSLLRDVLEQRMESAMEKLKLILSRADSIKAGIQHFLTGKELTPAQSLVVREYMKPQDQLEDERRQAEEEAGVFGYIFREKTRTYQELQKAARGENAGYVMKPHVVAYLEQMKDFDTRDLEHGTDEALLAQNDQLQELYILSKQFVDAANDKDPEDDQGRSIRDVFLENNHVSRELFTLKCSVIQSFAEKARFLAMIQAYQKGVLSENAFLEEELDAIRRQYDLMPEQAIGKNQLLSFVKERLTLAESSRYGAYNRFFQSEEAESITNGAETEPVHKEYLQERDRTIQEVKDALNLDHHPNGEDMKQYYRSCRRKVEVIEKALEDAGEEERPWLWEEFIKAKRKMEMVQIEYALTLNHYRKVDDLQSPLKEQFFRSYSTVEGIPVFRNMDDEFFRSMCVNLSEGALAPDAATPEGYDHYYAVNKEGLLIYKQCMRHHYEALEDRFHHQVPSMAYMLEHKQELSQLFASVQVDGHLVDGMRDIFDLTDEEDLRLYHLVLFYNGLGSYMEAVLPVAINESGDFKATEASFQNLIQQVQPSADYLGRDLNDPNLQEEENRDIPEQDVRRFRQLAEDAERIVEADRETQLEFRENTLALRNYIRQYQGNSPLVLKQLNGWYEFARKRVLFMAGDGGNSIHQLLDQVSKFRVTEDMLEPDYMRSHLEELQDSFRIMDEYQALVKNTPALKELLLSDQQRISWNIHRGLVERYRDYVTEFVRSQQLLNGGEEVVAEKERLQQQLSREKEGIREILGGFGGYTQRMENLLHQVSTMKKLKKADRENIGKPLREAGLWIRDLSEYVKRPLALSEEEFFDATIMTMMSMLGYIERNLRLTEEGLSRFSSAAEAGRIREELDRISGTFLQFKERIPGYAREIREDILNSGENISLTLQDVVIGAQGIKVFQINGQTERTGAGTSDVLILKDEEGTFFFKENETLMNFRDQVEEMLPLLEDRELSEKFRIFLDKEMQDNAGNLLESACLDLLGEFLTLKGGLLNEAMLQTLSYQGGQEVKDLVQVLARYLSGDHAKQEKWLAFANKFSKAFVTMEVTQDKSLKVEEGADMTSRNYASERVAELFGLKGLIVRNREAAVVDENGIRKKGFVMDKAKGKQAVDVVRLALDNGYKLRFTDDAQKNLLNLQILDNIVGQVDRHMGNYFLDYVKDDAQKTITVHQVTGIDNDFSFGLSEKIGGRNTASLLSEEKYYPGMIDSKMYESLMAISPDLLVVNLEGVIEPEYLEPLKKRYEKVRNAVREAKLEADQKGTDFFRKEAGWGREAQMQLAGPIMYELIKR